MFRPKKLEEEEKKDNKRRQEVLDTEKSNAKIIHCAFWNALVLILLFGLIGALIGYVFRWLKGAPSQMTISILQIVGASLLLWGTLFIRGFEIRTWDRNTLSERVNQWLYRAMYCLGTATIIFSLVW
jgi:phosphate/sulfate permease